MITMKELQAIREKAASGKQKDGVIIPAGELQRIRETMIIADPTESLRKKEMEKTMMQAAAKIKKDKLQKADRETKAKFGGETKLTSEQIQRANGMLSKAQQQLDEEHDDVKDMNMKMMFSKVVTIRDKQLFENKMLEKEYMEDQRRLDVMMEIERLKQIKLEQEREERKVAAKRVGQQVIVDQIQERHQIRIKEQEEKERESLIMKN